MISLRITVCLFIHSIYIHVYIYTQLSNMKVSNGPIHELALLLIGICPADGLAPLGPKLSAEHIVEL